MHEFLQGHQCFSFGPNGLTDRYPKGVMRGVAGMTGLTQELVDAMIEKVLVYGEGRIEVVLNYNDVFSAMCECVEQMKEAG